jgi:CHAT domain-containing protein
VPRHGAQATRHVLREASRSSVLHVATHAGHDALGPWLELADGRVHADAILDMQARPDLVVLATCLSAARPGDTMWGSLGAAFLAAGSQAVLATLWSVDDALTRRFVLRFYREGGASEPVEALARTQRAFIAAGEPASVWSPFVILGSGTAN